VSVAVSTPVFDGPFDLLLHLILKDEVDLYEVSLSTIVDEYIAVLEQMEDLELELATEFLLIAATLVELKSRRLLPDPPGSDLDEEFALWEERDLLLARLLECKTFKDAAATAPKPVIRVSMDHVAPISFSVSDAVSELIVDLPDRGKVKFRQLTAQLVDRIEVVVYFLAVLELYKQDLVDITQISSFGAIELEWVGDEAGDDALDLIDSYEG